jgi:peptidoglycan DL-endopeptidase CwlO
MARGTGCDRVPVCLWVRWFSRWGRCWAGRIRCLAVRGPGAPDAGSGLAGAGDLVRSGQRHMTGLSGTLPANYTSFASDAVQALDAASGTDTRLSGQVHDARGAGRSGWARSGAVVSGAATDTVRLAPVSGTPAGQRALIATLGARVAHVNAYKVQHARRAAVLRSLAYTTAGGGRSGGMPMGAIPFGAAPAGGRPGGDRALSGLGGAVSALAMLAGRFNPGTSAAAGLSSPAAPWAHRLGR